MLKNAKAVERISKVMGFKYDHRNKDLETEIKKSKNRIHKVRNGNGILNVFSSPLSRRGKDAYLKPKMTSIDNSEEAVGETPNFLNISLEEKLAFYDDADSPRTARRNLATSHKPWRSHPKV